MDTVSRLEKGHSKTGELIARLKKLIDANAITEREAELMLGRIYAILSAEQELVDRMTEGKR